MRFAASAPRATSGLVAQGVPRQALAEHASAVLESRDGTIYPPVIKNQAETMVLFHSNSLLLTKAKETFVSLWQPCTIAHY
jgi:hypothetical protein